jgi:hypothetical protein
MSIMTVKRLFRTLFLTLCVYGFFGWVYIVVNSEVHIYTLGWQLTHFAKWPHEDTFGEMCFLISFLSFFGYKILQEDKPARLSDKQK